MTDAVDPNEGMDEDDIFEAIVGSGNGAITILFDGDEDVSPRVNLGHIHPFAAIVVLQSVVEALELLVPDPEITYDDSVIFKTVYLSDDDDDN